MKINILSSITIIFVALALNSCNNKGKFVIEGKITNAKDSVLFLENVGLDGVTSLDSVKLAEDGSFNFKQDATTAPEFYHLRIANQIINISIDSTETVSINAAYPSMAYKYEVKGSENCTKIQELALYQMNLQAQVNNIASNPNLSVKAVDDSIGKVVDVYKGYVKMNYIYKEPNKSYSYFALFQTVFVDGKCNLIFNPHTSEDDVKVFAAVATSWDTFHPGAIRGENLHNIAIEGMKDSRILRARNQQMIQANKVDMSGVVDVVLQDNKGNIRRLTDLKGKVVILDFCIFADQSTTKRIMMMRALYDKYHAQGLEIYQVSLDGNEHFWKTQTAALPWVSVNDPAGEQSEYITKYNLQSLPTFYLINKDSTPYKRDAQIKDLETEIKTLL